jgi:hypothetical protein
MPSYTPHPAQRKAHNSPARRKWIWAGRRGGKDRFSVQEVMKDIDEASKIPFIVDDETADILGVPLGTDMTDTLIPQIHVWSVAPNFPQSRQAWNEMKALIPPHLVRKRVAGRAGGRGGSGWNEDRMLVELELKDEKGNWLKGRPRRRVLWEMKSADNPEALQTVGVDVLWIIEAQDLKEAAWEKIEPILNSPGRLGRMIASGIPPMSRAHWFSRRFRAALKEPSESDEAFHWTTFDNPYLTQSQRDDIWKSKENTTEGVWNRMYLAQQPDSGGSFFRKIQRAMRGTEQGRPRQGVRYVAGLDLGKQQDPTVFIVKDRSTRESVHSLEMLHRDWSLQIETLKAEAAFWKVDEIRMDATGMGGDVLFDELLNAGMPVIAFKFTNPSKYQLFLNYAVALEHENVSFPTEWVKLRDQLEAIEHRSTGSTHVFETIDNSHDDWVDAETLALMACDPAAVDQEGYRQLRAVSGPSPITGDKVPVRKNRMLRADWRGEQIEEAMRGTPDVYVNKEPVKF